MPIANFSTTVDALKTVGEIQGILVRHGAKSILMDYENGIITSLSFKVDTPHGEMAIRLPVNARAVLRVLKEQGVTPRYANYEQAVKIAWRIVKDWVRAQMALLETEMVRMEEVFFAYLLNPSGKTLYESMIDSHFQLTQGQELPDGK